MTHIYIPGRVCSRHFGENRREDVSRARVCLHILRVTWLGGNKIAVVHRHVADAAVAIVCVVAKMPVVWSWLLSFCWFFRRFPSPTFL